ncbi:MAG TPA: M90 family metallopeptidase [Gammaproteobacteria bacterium]|nr:M90 family metallopeptidase [Gammaproteobacteria bacterium]
MFDKLKNWREGRIIARRPIAEAHWRHALEQCAPARRLGASDQARLRVLATLFLDGKSIEPVQGLALEETDHVLLAAQACVPILKLGIDWYDGWHSLVIYPEVFVPTRDEMDEAGVVHRSRHTLSGEAWGRGPAILSWPDVLSAGDPPGHNVVIHEMAHKLDMLNGDSNGFPPLHRRMDRREWSRAFTDAWDRLQDDWAHRRPLPFDNYGLESPAEFFAVASETFFEQPAVLRAELPELYRQLTRFYRQQPAGD